MNPPAKLFSRTFRAVDILLQLKQVERDQRKVRRKLDVLEQAKQAKVEAAVAAKKAGRQELVQDIFRDTRQIELDYGHVNSDLRRLSLCKTALTAFLRRTEMLEKNKDRKSLQKLMRRYKSSSIQKAIDQAEVDDDTFISMLQEILGETDVAVTQEEAREDAGFAEFDRAIEEMAAAEGSGARKQSTPMAIARIEARARTSRKAKIMAEDPAELEKAIRVMEQQIEILTQQIEEAKRNLADLRARAAELKAQVAIKEQELREQQRELEVLIAKGEFEETMLEALKTMISKILVQVKDLKQQEDEANSKAKEQESLIESKEQELAGKQQELAYLRSQLA